MRLLRPIHQLSHEHQSSQYVAPSSSSLASQSDKDLTKPSKPNEILLRLLSAAPLFLLFVGITIFTKSFFLSRTSFEARSSCRNGAAGNILMRALGMEWSDVQFMMDEGWLTSYSITDNQTQFDVGTGGGCWVPRRVDSMVILVVDALRFDFARDHLPLSVGSRLFSDESKSNDGNRTAMYSRSKGYSQLYQFVADPPTVTMQRLKGLTTGGLPTFADITGSFGGASIEEDSWVEQLKNTPWEMRHYLNSEGLGRTKRKPQIAFVGDDTWVDLFPTQFDDCHPYPSFNTRDLDTVDDGCFLHLPRLLKGLTGVSNKKYDTNDNNSSTFELIVTHFLGVDHVGHTYGPHDPHMDRKLNQMDTMLLHTFDTVDNASTESCIAVLVFGDHGMTEDGNHGGGTSDEMNAGLFAHFSPGCQDIKDDRKKYTLDGKEIGVDSIRAFQSINQIDLVPTISILLGLPIPYANIGGLVPELLPMPRNHGVHHEHLTSSTVHAAAALALNSAQVWTYFDDYSKLSNDLPVDKLKDLKELLDSATFTYKAALALSKKQKELRNDHNYNDSSAYRQACSLFKLFLAESTGLGKQVWTQFNDRGMILGVVILAFSWVMIFPPLWKKSVCKDTGVYSKNPVTCMKGYGENKFNYNIALSYNFLHQTELVTAFIFMIFHCGFLSFSNSYIENEQVVVVFFLSILCLLVFRRWYYAPGDLKHVSTHYTMIYFPLIVPFCARVNEVLVTGHGLDPSIRLHCTHHTIVFLSSLSALAALRLRLLSGPSSFLQKGRSTFITSSALIDTLVIICLAFAWWEKRSRDHSRNGFTMTRAAFALTFAGLLHSFNRICYAGINTSSSKGRPRYSETLLIELQLALFRAMMLLVILTGPSTASTGALIILQAAGLCQMMKVTGTRQIEAPVMAAMWRLAIRHAFFATNHRCSFNRLHYSAAFVATENFYFHIAGLSLFMNTFGWEIIGSILVLVLSRAFTCCGVNHKSSIEGQSNNIWLWYRFYQWTEILSSCISVSVMKRHLMVWAIFAPRFMFAAIFTGINLVLCLIDRTYT